MVLRWLAMQWLRDSASRAAREAVTETMSRATSEEQGDEYRGRSELPCHAAILCALDIEAAGIVEKLCDVKRLQGAEIVAHIGLLGKRRVVVAITGPGETRAAAATQAVIAGHQPRWIIASGFAGGLAEQVERGDLIVANALLRLGGARLAIPLSLESSQGVHVGSQLTIDHIARSASEKKGLHRASEALAADMETFAIGEICRENQIRMLSVRAVTDAANDELPRDIEHLMNQDTTIGRVGAVTGAIFRRPGSVKDMWNLREQAIVCGDRLAGFLPELIDQLPE